MGANAPHEGTYIVMKSCKCPVCGKSFILPYKNVYKQRVGDSMVHLCSWTCLNKFRRGLEADQQKK